MLKLSFPVTSFALPHQKKYLLIKKKAFIDPKKVFIDQKKYLLIKKLMIPTKSIYWSKKMDLLIKIVFIDPNLAGVANDIFFFRRTAWHMNCSKF